MRNTITRTFTTNYADCIVYENGKLLETVIALPDSCILPGIAEKYIRKNPSTISGKLVEVKEIRKETILYGMDENDFISAAKVYDVRGKDTRNLITKTVKGFKGEYLYMDTSSRELKTRRVYVPADMENKLDKFAKSIEAAGEKAITIENLTPINTLYGMTEKEFQAMARKMTDHQHYAE